MTTSTTKAIDTLLDRLSSEGIFFHILLLEPSPKDPTQVPVTKISNLNNEDITNLLQYALLKHETDS